MAKTTAFQTVPTLPIRVEGGIFYAFDAGRDIFITPNRLTMCAGKKGTARNLYLRMVDGQASNLAGYRINKESVVTTVSAQSKGTGIWRVHLRKNNDVANLYSLVVSDGGAHDNNVDVRLDAGDTLQFYCESNSFFGIKHPTVWVEVAGKL
jgi:hypothetical protein